MEESRKAGKQSIEFVLIARLLFLRVCHRHLYIRLSFRCHMKLTAT
jgi:hypothetical protein